MLSIGHKGNKLLPTHKLRLTLTLSGNGASEG